MSVLVDHEIDALMAATPPLATNVVRGDFTGAESPIQAASLNLSIGDIFKPGKSDYDLGGAERPLSELTLLQGHTAVIRTNEKLNLGPDLVAIGFPPASLAVKGLLVTNPGQVDPGYQGPLHLTVINMSHEPVQLRKKDKIIRLVFLKLGANPSAAYNIRHPGSRKVISLNLLSSLSNDFLDVETRAEKIAKDVVTRARFVSAGIAAAISVITIFVTILLGSGSTLLGGNISKLTDQVNQLDERVSTLEGRGSITDLNIRLQKVEEKLAKLSTGGH